MEEREQPTPVEPVHGGDPLHAPFNATLAELLAGYHSGRVTRYWAGVPRSLVQPFDAAYDPSTSATWAPVYRDVVQRMRDGVYPNLVAYQHGDVFVVGDDYLALHAYRETAAPWVACYLLGEPESGALRGLRLGPEEAALRDAHERGRDYEQTRWLYEFLQRSDIREWNGHPPAEPRR